MYKILLASGFPIYMTGFSGIAKEALPTELEIYASTSIGQMRELLATVDIQLLVLDMQLSVTYDMPFLIKKITGRFPKLKIILSYHHNDLRLFRQLYQCGVQGILGHRASINNTKKCLVNVYGNELYIENSFLVSMLKTPIKKILPEKPQPKPIDHSLTMREKMIARLLVEGKNNAQICGLLQLRPSTVSTFKKRVYQKLQITNLLELEKVGFEVV